MTPTENRKPNTGNNIDPKTLVNPVSFDEQFFKLLPTAATHREAFNQLNEIYCQAFGQYRYKDFDSYRVAKHRRYRKSK